MTTTKKEKEFEESVKLRFDFIGMMFALAIGQVGLEVGKFYSSNNSLFSYPYVFTHLVLAIFIIASSWIGWKHSKSKGSVQAVEDTFSLSFILLLIDLFLVLCYFIFVSKVDSIKNPDSDSEIYWSLIIFSTYFIWDVLSKLIIIEDHVTLKMKIDFKGFISRGYQSFLCAFIVLFLFKPINGNMSSKRVMIIDFALLCTFILFRGMKTINLFSLKNNKEKVTLFLGIILPIIGILTSIILTKYYV